MEPDREPSDATGTAGELAHSSGIGPQPGDQAQDDLRAGGTVAGGGVRGSGERDIAIRDGGDDSHERRPTVRRDWWGAALAGFRRAVRLSEAEGKDITVTVQPINLRSPGGRRVIVLDPMGMDDLRAAIISARLLVFALTLLLLAVGGYVMRLRQREEMD
jgi:hypothetical protein